MIKAEEKVKANKARQEEYKIYRENLVKIANGEDTADTDRIHAIELIMTIDRDGAPPVYKY